MEQIPPPKEVKILETAEDIQERREQVKLYLLVLNDQQSISLRFD